MGSTFRKYSSGLWVLAGGNRDKSHCKEEVLSESLLILILPEDDQVSADEIDTLYPSKGTAVGIGGDTAYRAAVVALAVGSQLVASYPALAVGSQGSQLV